MRDEFLWVEKYRPRTVQDTILPEATKSAFQSYVDQKNIPNLLLSGGPGVGKTTVAKAMLEELNCDYIVINGSMNGNIDTLRNEIQQFASSVSLTGGRKYVILDEADFLNCLSEDEHVRLTDGTSMRLGDMSLDETYEVIAFNIHTREFENDVAQVVHIDHKESFEVEMEDGRKIVVTDDHPFIVLDENDTVSTRSIKDGLDGYRIISM